MTSMRGALDGDFWFERQVRHAPPRLEAFGQIMHERAHDGSACEAGVNHNRFPKPLASIPVEV